MERTRTYRLMDGLELPVSEGQTLVIDDGWQHQEAVVTAVQEMHIEIRYAAYGFAMTKTIHMGHRHAATKHTWTSKSYGDNCIVLREREERNRWHELADCPHATCDLVFCDCPCHPVERAEQSLQTLEMSEGIER